MENTLFYIFLFLIYPVLMLGTILFCTRKKEESKLSFENEISFYSDDLEIFQADEDKEDIEIDSLKSDNELHILEDDEDDQLLDLMMD